MIGLLTLVLALGAPASAHAALAEVIADPTAPEVRLTAALGESNDMTATATGGAWSLADANARVWAGAGCVQINPNLASCPNSSLAALPLVVLAGDGDDRVTVTDAPRSSIYGGAGNDTLRGGLHDDELYGGPGNDLLVGAGGRDELSGGPGDDRLEFSTRPAALACGNGVDALVAPRGVPLISAAMPRDCERVALGPLLVSAVPQRRGASYLVQAGCGPRSICRASLSLKLLPERGGAITLSSGSFRLAPGRGTTFAIALSPSTRRLLARNRLGRLQVSVVTRNTGDPGPPRRTAWRVRL
jgi:hypothetical protein